MSGECEGISYYKNKAEQSLIVRCEPGTVYKGPVLDLTTSSGERIVHFKIDNSGSVALGANCGGVGDPKSGMGFGDASQKETAVDLERLDGEFGGMEYYKIREERPLVVRSEPGAVYAGPVFELTTSAGERIVHFKIDESGVVTLGANCGGVGDPKSGMGFGNRPPEDDADSDQSSPGNPQTGMGWSSNVKSGA